MCFREDHLKGRIKMIAIIYRGKKRERVIPDFGELTVEECQRILAFQKSKGNTRCELIGQLGQTLANLPLSMINCNGKNHDK
jgi:hypothetical protein